MLQPAESPLIIQTPDIKQTGKQTRFETTAKESQIFQSAFYLLKQ